MKRKSVFLASKSDILVLKGNLSRKSKREYLE